MKLTIFGTLPGLNEIIDANRRNVHSGAKLKKEAQFLVVLAARKCLKKWRPSGPVWLGFTWYEPNKKRDKDNVAGGGRKIILDALVEAGVIKNDGWNEIAGFTDDFKVDKNTPRVEVEIEEVNQ